MTVKKQPDGTWSVDFYVDGRGSRRVRRGGFRSKAHAQRFERDYVVSPEPATGRFSGLVDLWYRVYGCTLKSGPRRLAALRLTVARLGDPYVSEFTSSLWSNYRTRRMKEVIPATMNIEQLYVSSVFAELIRQGHYQGVNPLSQIKLFKVDQKPLAFLSFEQIDQLLGELRNSTNPYVLMIARIALATGARWSEAQNLRRSQVLGDRIVFSATKNGKLRTVPVDPELLREALALALPSDRMFGPARGAYERAYLRCGFETPGQLTHMLRHTFASHFVMAGGDLRTLKDILGHADITTTMLYAHLAPEYLDKARSLNPLALASMRGQGVVNS
ncbi:tyrosine-type recombinase/integrase [Pseudomonas sp. JS3066]|uniref:phage integrase n=1 Tax=Pseudomonas sp. JS3066 TaxID=3090665 RepID=UPI002E7AFE06|nr:tyrosine-type recombinase/integrase [Pseudomonas sp. JS3066]WVK92257.1 tyrosine-type recombinase/integrase [Pseudomonas sp. JS3066]